jgi:hypothetical protein
MVRDCGVDAGEVMTVVAHVSNSLSSLLRMGGVEHGESAE